MKIIWPSLVGLAAIFGDCAAAGCSNGVAGILDNFVCCPLDCGTCGGDKCGQRTGGPEACCVGAIVRSDVYCGDPGATAPCIDGSRPTPSPTCSSGIFGIENNDVCCPLICGTCGGKDCAKRPGGARACCSQSVKDSKVYCEDQGATAPCITGPRLGSDEGKCPDGIDGIQANGVCCPSSCGTCGGRGCAQQPGGSDCCTSAIKGSDVYCGDSGATAPCIVGDRPESAACPNNIDGILANDVCCPTSCGTCGGRGCAALPGGSDACCTQAIEDSNVYCSDDGATAPCIAGDRPLDTCPSSIDSILRDGVCCPATCGACGGQQCRSSPGGARDCCTGAIIDSDIYCGDPGANPPCIAGDRPVCEVDADCPNLGQECCPSKKVCEVPPTDTPGACGDPHFTGFRGQKFDFVGRDGDWYAVVSDKPNIHVNMRVTAPVRGMSEITYITGIGIKTADSHGVDHTILIEVDDPSSLDSACPAGVSPCLADGALAVELDGERSLLSPGEVQLGPGVAVAAVNLPGPCRSFGYEEYWERKKAEYAASDRRRLSSNTIQEMSQWILGDPTVTNMDECTEYVARATAFGGEASLFVHNSEHASFQILTPTGTIRLSHGRLHQVAMHDPTNGLDLPDHHTWQMNLAIDYAHLNLDASGILGETLVPTVDADGQPVMQGMESIRGLQEDYRVEGPLETKFDADTQHE